MAELLAACARLAAPGHDVVGRDHTALVLPDPLYIGAVIRAVTPVAARGAGIAFVASAAAARHRRPDVALMSTASAAAARLDGARRCVPGPSVG